MTEHKSAVHAALKYIFQHPNPTEQNGYANQSGD